VARFMFTKPAEGEWVQPIRRGYKLSCCDCGLVHRMNFRIHGGRVQFQAWRHERSTATTRAWKTRKRGTDR
jgi:hypothetical protein